MSDQILILHTPEVGQTLEQYLQSFTDDELTQIRNNPQLLERFAGILQETFREVERAEDALEKLWSSIQSVNNVNRLLYFIRQLEPIRRELLKTLDRNAEEIQRLSTYSTVGRLVGSSADIVGTVAGLWMTDANPGLSNLSFRAAAGFGLLGFLTTVFERNSLKNSIEDLTRLIKRDQQMFAPIQQWYQQTNELEKAMQSIFPFDITNDEVTEITNIWSTDITPDRLLARLLGSIAQEDLRYMRDETLIQNLITFTVYPACQDWCTWIIYRRHSVMFDVTTIIMQSQNSPLLFDLCQSILVLSLGSQNIQSFPVWGRMALNAVSIFDSVNTLQSTITPAIVSEIEQIRRHLNSELVSLLRIEEFIRLRRR